MNPYLSIIVPIYKVEPYLHQCIDSILAQTFEDFELILVDDGSPDNCPAICDEYATLDKRIKVIHKPNGGLVSTRKAGLRVARGEYVGFVDGDDWIESDMFSSLCQAAKQYITDIIICDVIHSYPDKKIRHVQPIKPGLYDKNSMERFVYPYMLYSGIFFKFGLHPSVCNKIFRRYLLENNLYRVSETIQIGEDAACTYPCLLDANSIYIMNNRYLYYYRQIPSSITKCYDSEYLKNILELYDLMRDINREKNIYDMTEQLCYYLSFLVIAAVNNEINENNKKSSNEKSKFLKSISKNEDIHEALEEVSTAGILIKYKLYIWLLRERKSGILNFVVSMIRRAKGKSA